MFQVSLRIAGTVAASALTSAALVLAAPAAFAQTIKIGYIDPLSGPFANVGEADLKQFQFVVAQPTSCQMKRPAKP